MISFLIGLYLFIGFIIIHPILQEDDFLLSIYKQAERFNNPKCYTFIAMFIGFFVAMILWPIIVFRIIKRVFSNE